MDSSKSKYKNISEYIYTFPKEIRSKMQELREIIKKEAPESVESISYQMPTFKLNGKNLVHFAGWKNHIGFYPTPSATKEFNKELSKYKYSKGAIQFPLDQSLPVQLIRKIVRFRVKENLKKR